MAYFENNEINNCTRCGKKFTDLRMQVTLELYTERLRDTGIWEEIPNLCQESVEYLCPECFDKWVDIQSQMDIPYQENPRYQDVDPHITDKYREPGSSKLSDPYKEPQKGDKPLKFEEQSCCSEGRPSLTPNFDAKIEELCRKYEQEFSGRDLDKPSVFSRTDPDSFKEAPIKNNSDCRNDKPRYLNKEYEEGDGSLFTESLHSQEPAVVQAKYTEPDF